MKKILSASVFSLLISLGAYSQYFQGSFTNPVNPAPPPATLNQLVFKMRPTADITTSIAYMEFAFRYVTANTPAFSIANIVNNTTDFPGLRIDPLTDFVEGTYTYKKFVFNTATIPSATYLSGVEKDIFTITLRGNTTDIIPMLEMASDQVSGNYVFGVANGAGDQIAPGTGAQLYGTGFNIVGNTHLLPLANVPLPVKFLGFNAVKRDDNAVLTWQIENESSLTDHYEVERSLNGVDFKKVNAITPKNNGYSSNSYELTDLNISALRSVGIFYYRIKQVDKNGHFIYTGIKSVRLTSKGLVIGVYPNPTRNFANITIDLEQDADAAITINDASGKQVQIIKMQLFKGPNIKKINMEGLAAGSYMLKVQTATEIKTMPVAKTN